MDKQDLKTLVRSVTGDDRNRLPSFSYSKIDTFKKCPFQYDKKYNHKMYPNDTSLALELGSLCHYVLEQKGNQIQADMVDYDILKRTLYEGTIFRSDKTRRPLPGVKEIRNKYFEEWLQKDDASGMDYNQKIEVFKRILHTEMEEDDWVPTYFEYHFSFVWDERAIIDGFIDRIDIRDGEFRTIDYKTSKKIYSDRQLATSLQFGIYALAILNDFDELPVESIYRFILIDDAQNALTKGWEGRLYKILTNTFNQIEDKEEKNVWEPHPTPLCYWCNYCRNNPNATRYRNECDFYSLWTPMDRTFQKNQEWDEGYSQKQKIRKKRKLIF